MDFLDFCVRYIYCIYIYLGLWVPLVNLVSIGKKTTTATKNHKTAVWPIWSVPESPNWAGVSLWRTSRALGSIELKLFLTHRHLNTRLSRALFLSNLSINQPQRTMKRFLWYPSRTSSVSKLCVTKDVAFKTWESGNFMGKEPHWHGSPLRHCHKKEWNVLTIMT